MKKTAKTVLAILVTMLVWSCGSNGNHKFDSNSRNNGKAESSKPMQYTVKVSDDFIFWMGWNKIETGATFRVYECAENGDKIYENAFEVAAGSSKTFTAQPNAKKVKVHVTISNPLGELMNESQGWLPLVYYLSPDETKVISIDNHFEMHRTEP